MEKNEFRKVKIFIGCKWVESKFSDIKKDSVFRLFEDDDTPVTSNGNPNFLAISDVFLNSENIGTVCVEEYHGF